MDFTFLPFTCQLLKISIVFSFFFLIKISIALVVHSNGLSGFTIFKSVI
jgi:hypothetical protein